MRSPPLWVPESPHCRDLPTRAYLPADLEQRLRSTLTSSSSDSLALLTAVPQICGGGEGGMGPGDGAERLSHRERRAGAWVVGTGVPATGSYIHSAHICRQTVLSPAKVMDAEASLPGFESQLRH